MKITKNSVGSILLFTLGIIVPMVVLGAIVVNVSANKAISYEENVSQCYSDLTTQYKRREDLIENLVDSVKAYDKHEAETLKEVIGARNEPYSDYGDTSVSKQISVVVEAYPQLQSSDNYKQLMLELTTTENKIANYRESYNTSVKDYRKYCMKFPHKQFLSLAGYSPENFSYLELKSSEDSPKNLFSEDRGKNE